ncbi:MAG: hypothetical protein ACRDOO_18785 [Actinomadura sp.]
MSITVSQYEMVITKIENNVANIGVALARIQQAVDHGTWDRTAGLAQKLIAKINEMLASSRFPVIMDQYEAGWRKAHGHAAHVASDVQRQVDEARAIWGGDAGAAFQRGVALQAPATGAVASMARVIAETCAKLRDAGYAFYAGIGAAVAGCVTTLSGTTEPPVALAIAAIGAAWAALLAQVNTGRSALQEIPGGGTAFPKGGWPLATTS